jgi:hypothetical protein
MKITLELTDTIVTTKTPDGSMPARVWEGRTESGFPIYAYVTRVFAILPDDVTRIEREQEATRPMTPTVLQMLIDRESEPPTHG